MLHDLHRHPEVVRKLLQIVLDGYLGHQALLDTLRRGQQLGREGSLDPLPMGIRGRHQEYRIILGKEVPQRTRQREATSSFVRGVAEDDGGVSITESGAPKGLEPTVLGRPSQVGNVLGRLDRISRRQAEFLANAAGLQPADLPRGPVSGYVRRSNRIANW